MENSAIKIRAHHIKNLIAYSFNPKLSDTEFFYGKEFVEKAINLFGKILAGQTSVTVVDNYDGLCEVCGHKTEEGCSAQGSFDSAGEGSHIDRKYASWYNLKIGATYEGSDFLGKLGLEPKLTTQIA